MSRFKPRMYWHIHHEALVELSSEPIKHRIDYIKKCKPEYERELRLRLLKPVRGKLPYAVAKALKVFKRAAAFYRKANKAYEKNWIDHHLNKKYNEAWASQSRALNAFGKTLVDHREEIEVLHARECPDCPWDGYTIFPGVI